jgi:hypothetical protein
MEVHPRKVVVVVSGLLFGVWGFRIQSGFSCAVLVMTRFLLNVICSGRKIVRDNICPCCCREMESGLHPLWNCPIVQDVWGGGSVIFQKSAFLGDTFM